MPASPVNRPLSAERAVLLAEFARACRTATRSVSLYPATHPSIQSSLARVMASAGRLVPTEDVTLTVFPSALAIDGETPEHTDPAVGELAGLMHDRLIGALRVERGADALDWHAMLLLLARPSEELLDEGGIAKAWAATGRAHFEIHEIDYAEVLRERLGGDAADWDKIIHMSVQAGQGPLDESALSSLLSTMGDPARFGGLLEQLQQPDAIGDDPDGDTTVRARTAAMLQIVRKMLEATSQWPQAQGEDVVLQTAADASSRLTPDMMLALINRARSPEAEGAALAGDVVDRITDGTVASFVAGSVADTGGASERLAQAFEALVPEADRKERLLDLAKEEAHKSRLGQQQGFEEMWQSAVTMLTSYSDETYVSSEYARELSSTKTTAIDVERVSDDPPERVQTWLASVSDKAVHELDLTLLKDLLQVEEDPATWLGIARLVVTEIERQIKAGEVQEAHALAFAILREAEEGGRKALRSGAESAINALADGPFARHIVALLRTVDDSDVEPLMRLCRAIGAPILRPLAESLAEERDSRAIARLKELLFGFGSAGRDMVGRLKQSSHPEVRSTAIDLLRMFGGEDALAELATMLDDRDPEVRRNATRAVAQFGTDEGFAELQRALLAGAVSGRTIAQQVADLHGETAVPLLCYTLSHSEARGNLVDVHTQIITALGSLGSHPESIQVLRAALSRGEWWAPFRTAALRKAAALALRRIGSSEARAVLDEAKRQGSRGVRRAASSRAPKLPRPSGRGANVAAGQGEVADAREWMVQGAHAKRGVPLQPPSRQAANHPRL